MKMYSKVLLVFVFFFYLTNANDIVQDSSELLVSEETHHENHEVIIQWLRKLFDHHHWRGDVLRNVSQECKQHVKEYVSELKSGTTWALKMYDASGRYSDQFFFGNDFWLGSSTLCWELQNPETNINIPPFKVKFNIAKFLLKYQVGHGHQATTHGRYLMVGECLPLSCSTSDVSSIMERDSIKSLASAKNATMESLYVRPVPGEYRLVNDFKFYIVGGTGVAILILVVIATVYEICSTRDKKCYKSDEEQQNTTNNNNETKEMTNGINIKKIDHSKKEIHRGIPSRLLLCFSARTNTAKILSVDILGEDSVRCIHGLRFLSIAWIILVHTYLQVFAIAENKTLRILTERYYIYQTISNATFSVDSFFFISGFLVTILYFRTSKKNQSLINKEESTFTAISNGTKKFFLLVSYRFLRLTPAYLFVLGINMCAMRYFYNNSVFEPGLQDHVTCDKYWWRNALYINTYYPQAEICMLWSWYMSNDTQFYVMAVILLLIAVRGPRLFKLSAILTVTFLVTSWITTFIVAYQYDYHAKIEEPFALFDQLYDKPWMRVGPYLIGMFTGWLIFRINGKVRLPHALVAVCWLASFGILLSLVYGLGKDGLKVPYSAFYAALGHSAWGLALGWITLACCTGYGGPINTLLSFRGFLPLSRLTYCAYLLHPMLMTITSFQMDGPLHLHNAIVLVIYMGNVLAAFLLSLVISLGFEAPVVRLLKIIVGGKKDQ